MELPFQLDETTQYMVDKTGYFIDVANEEKYIQIGCNWMKGDGATDAEMKLWTYWEVSLRGTNMMMNKIGGKLDNIIENLSKAVAEKKCVEPA